MFHVPPGTNELISQHLVNSAEIARRTGVTRAAVANWTQRHPEFAATAIPLSTSSSRSYVFWWPQVEECLKELGIPNESAKRRGRQPTVRGGPDIGVDGDLDYEAGKDDQ
jgi:hypothetical protein